MTERVFSALAAILAAWSLTAFLASAAAKEKKPNPADPVLLRAVEDWSAWHYVEGGTRVCYATAHPATNRGTVKNRGEASALVTWRRSEGRSANALSGPVVSFVAGYAFRPKIPVTAALGKTEFALFSNADAAWAVDEAGDKALVAAMAKGGNLILRGTASTGAATADTYRLAGFKDAYALVQKECGAR